MSKAKDLLDQIDEDHPMEFDSDDGPRNNTTTKEDFAFYLCRKSHDLVAAGHPQAAAHLEHAAEHLLGKEYGGDNCMFCQRELK